MKPPTQKQIAALPAWAWPLVIAQLRKEFEEQARQVRLFIYRELDNAVRDRTVHVVYLNRGLASEFHDTKVYVCDPSVDTKIVEAARGRFLECHEIDANGVITTLSLRWLLLEAKDASHYLARRYGICADDFHIVKRDMQQTSTIKG
jgi:hypothetical protein